MKNGYGDKVRFYMVDVADITPPDIKSQFPEGEVEQLANQILEVGCLLKPLILKQTGPMKYELIEGHLEYWAAVNANKKDTEREMGGMVSAMVIKSEIEGIAKKQIETTKRRAETTKTKKSTVAKKEERMERVNREHEILNPTTTETKKVEAPTMEDRVASLELEMQEIRKLLKR